MEQTLWTLDEMCCSLSVASERSHLVRLRDGQDLLLEQKVPSLRDAQQLAEWWQEQYAWVVVRTRMGKKCDRRTNSVIV